MDSIDSRLQDSVDHSQQPLVCVKSEKTKRKENVQVLPEPPKDCCTICDPVCMDDLKLAIVSTFLWMLLGILPIVVGFVAIYYAKKARKTKHPLDKEYYSRVSRTISWLGMLLFTIFITILVIVLATCGIL